MEKAQLLLRLPADMKKKLEGMARGKGISTTGLILIILDAFIEKKGA